MSDSASPDVPPLHQPPRCRWGAMFLLATVAWVQAWAASTWSWIQIREGRSAQLQLPATGKTGFTRLDPTSTGVDFVNRLSVDRSLTNHVLLNGSGVALGDADGDGWCDLFFAGLNGGSQLYRNLGDWKFTNITAQAFGGARNPLAAWDATGAVFADLDGDGALDLLVNTVGQGTRFFHNDGHGAFEERTDSAGLGGKAGSMSMALADVDGDGDLDLYVVNYRTSTVRDEFQQRFEIKAANGVPTIVSVNGRPVSDPDLVGRFSVDLEGHITEHGQADQLFLNDGKAHFTAVSFTGGAFTDQNGKPLTAPPYDWGLAAMFRDVDGDGAPDLYVCNDLNSPDRFWWNDGRGHFRAAPRTSLRKTSWFSMGIDFGDLNRDGHDDFLVTDMLSRDRSRRQADVPPRATEAEAFTGGEARPQTPRNTLFLGRGDGTFAEAAWLAGLAASDWSWSPVFLDVDLDGYEDVLISTGFERDVQDADVAEEIEAIRQREKLSDAAALQLRRRFPSLAQPNLAFHNRGDVTFEEVGKSWGFDIVGISQGMALADLDHDGDLDVVINNQNSPALLLRNDSTAPRLAIRLQGRPPNTQGIGARIEVAGGPVAQSQEVISGARYLSGDDPVRVFAAGTNAAPLSVHVRWRSGAESALTNIAANQLLELREPEAGPRIPKISTVEKPLFEDVSDRLHHRHTEAEFADFQRQPLLPTALSQAGPGVAWGDVNGDGHDDLVIGSGRSGLMGVYLNDGHGAFVGATNPVLARASILDQAGILVWPAASGPASILAGFDAYEAPQANSGIRIFDLKAGVMRLGGPSLAAALGPVAAADVDGDGQLDLFLGGRAVAGRYPIAAPSALYLGSQSGFTRDSRNQAQLARLGLTSGAVFTDIDGDGAPDLVTAEHWGPIQIFHNDHGQLVKQDWPIRWESEGTGPTHLNLLTGLWNGITAVDLDNDGRLDLVASNWGRNTKYQTSADRELRLYFRDVATNSALPLLEVEYDLRADQGWPFASRDRIAEVWPELRQRFPTRQSFGAAPIATVLGDQLPSYSFLTARVVDSIVLLNRGDYFLARQLPREAQMAPAFSVVATDFDGDGNEDLFLSQNFFATGPETDRHDGGLGLLLRGDGHGNLAAWEGGKSGIRVVGEQHGAATADFDEDGRPDLVVTQNREATRLFHNTSGQPGLRVRLQGPPGNPSGIGVQLRMSYPDNSLGPVREVHAGSGYWSQDGTIPILGRKSTPTGLWVRWPNQPPKVLSIPEGAKEVRINPAGLAGVNP